MASITITTSRDPHRAPRRLRAAATTLWATLATAARTIATPHRAALTNLGRIPLTAAGTGCIDYAAFHLAHGWGWLVTGVSLVFIEHLIADETGDTQRPGRQ